MLLFCPIDSVLCCTEAIQFHEFRLLMVEPETLMSYLVIFHMPMHLRLFCAFSDIRFTVSGFTFRSLICFDLSFVKSDKYGSIFIIQLQTTSYTISVYWKIEGAFFLQLYSFGFFVKVEVSIGTWVYFRVFYSFPLIKLSVSVWRLCSFYHYHSVVQVEFRNHDSLISSFIFETVLPILFFFFIWS